MAATPWLAGCASKALPGRALEGEIVGASARVGHQLRQIGNQRAQGERKRYSVLIAGGGIAGLSAAWRLMHAGVDDFCMLELEPDLGGNSRAAHYPASAAPWAAHYLPLPTDESRVVRRILAEMGLYRDGKFDIADLCHAPEERLLVAGHWEEGLFPQAGASTQDFADLRAFEAHIREWQAWRDRQGRKAFAIPLALSSQDPEVTRLDRISMEQYLLHKGWRSPRLHWHVEYGCRDDYGTSLKDTSAWAGLHYFASRDSRGGPSSDAQYVWPEGNHRLVQHLGRDLGERRRTRSLVRRLERGPKEWQVDVWDDREQRLVGLSAARVILALPTFQRPFLLGEARRPDFSYAPWTVSNLVLERMPESAYSQPGAALSWDNVIYGSGSLGYVVSTHQTRSYQGGPSVFTHYRPWSELQPAQARQQLLDSTWEQARDQVLADMLRVHPDLLEVCGRIDVMQLGHAMIRPTPGFIWGPERQAAAIPQDGLYFAHSDLSGMSIFEEASYQGVRAAQQLLADSGSKVEDFL